ncbi:MAG TPA: Bax inhibitor-1/YccA family protein [Rhizomicrobium sp.]|nr:Bax inhibitor-1/YccA family protein [Rhizomicrobium sp.]
MADYDNRAIRATTAAADIDAGLRAFMLRVYNYMFLGLALTGATAYGTFLAAVTADPSVPHKTLPNGVMLTQFGQMLFGPLMWVFLLGSLGLVLFLSFRIQSMSVAAARTSFLAYAALIGVTFSSIFIVYTQASVAEVFFITAATFGAMSLWGYTTRTDLTGFGSFLFMGLIGIVIAMVVNLFVHSAMISWVVSIIGVLVFTGLTAYDSQKIKENYVASDDGTVLGRKAIFGALQLYLDFINLFLMLLRLMGNRR